MQYELEEDTGNLLQVSSAAHLGDFQVWQRPLLLPVLDESDGIGDWQRRVRGDGVCQADAQLLQVELLDLLFVVLHQLTQSRRLQMNFIRMMPLMAPKA